MTEREAMQQALEALELLARYENPATKIQVRKTRDGGPIVTMYPHKVATDAAAPLRERLAHPEAPVLTGIDCSCGRKWRIVNNTLTASEPETVMAEYKFQTYAACKTDGEMKIGVVPEPEQEPVCAHGVGKTKCDFCKQPAQPSKPWVGLTDDEISAVDWRANETLHDFARAIEAKLKEKNNANGNS